MLTKHVVASGSVGSCPRFCVLVTVKKHFKILGEQHTAMFELKHPYFAAVFIPASVYLVSCIGYSCRLFLSNFSLIPVILRILLLLIGNSSPITTR